MATVGTLRACIDNLDDGFRSIWLDLSGLTFLDSSGIGLIAELNQRCGPDLRELTVRCPAGQVRTVLSISGIDQVVKVVD
jgi:anti-anti-sigma factor